MEEILGWINEKAQAITGRNVCIYMDSCFGDGKNEIFLSSLEKITLFSEIEDYYNIEFPKLPETIKEIIGYIVN